MIEMDDDDNNHNNKNNTNNSNNNNVNNLEIIICPGDLKCLCQMRYIAFGGT